MQLTYQQMFVLAEKSLQWSAVNSQLQISKTVKIAINTTGRDPFFLHEDCYNSTPVM